MRRLALATVTLTALVAACTPSTFDGLSGGTKDRVGRPQSAEDKKKIAEALKDHDPRPVAPFSGSWVNTSRPKLTWKLAPGINETTVEISRTRDFASPQRLPAAGTALTVDKDLEPGIWFWRLQARQEDIASGTYGPVWSVLVRGKAKNATADNTAAHGGFTDANGDGVPDLVISYSLKKKGETPNYPEAAVLIGSGLAGTTTFDPFVGGRLWFEDAATDAPTLASGFDFDGDGFGDVVIADVWSADNSTAARYGVGGRMFPIFGGPLERPAEGEEEPEPEPVEGDGPVPLFGFDIPMPTFKTVPALAAGDFNGDGYGDLTAMFSELGTLVQGNANGISFTLVPFVVPATAAPAAANPFFVGAGAFDDDGISDFAYTPFDPISPIRMTKGDAISYRSDLNLSPDTGVSLSGALTAMTTGDFNGDGTDEVAFAITANGAPAVCVSDRMLTLNIFGCWTSPAPIIKLGSGDADGDGVDEIFIGSAEGITILAHEGLSFADATSVFTPTKVAGSEDFSANFAVFFPGYRGESAQWAVYGKGASATNLFVVTGFGKEPGQRKSVDFKLISESPSDEFKGLEFVKFGTSMR